MPELMAAPFIWSLNRQVASGPFTMEATTGGIYTHVVPEVFAGVAAAVDTASQQLMDGTYTPKRSAEAVRAQLQQIDPMLSEDMTVNLKYL